MTERQRALEEDQIVILRADEEGYTAEQIADALNIFARSPSLHRAMGRRYTIPDVNRVIDEAKASTAHWPKS